MYDRAVTSVRTSWGITNEFPIIIGLHQGSTLSNISICIRYGWAYWIDSRCRLLVYTFWMKLVTELTLRWKFGGIVKLDGVEIPIIDCFQ